MAEALLSGVKVLDLTWYIAGPACTKLLADYGADVLKVERPDGGDPARNIGPFLNDDPHPDKSITFSYLNLNKRGITLDLKSAAGKKALLDLVKGVDILVESFSPRVMGALGLGYQALKEVNPTLVMTSISNFGQDGPYRDFKASELVLTGMGKDQYHNGIDGRQPLKLGGNAALHQAGYLAALATLAGYWFAAVQGVGQHIDCSMQQMLSTDIDFKTANVLAWAYNGRGYEGRRDPRDTVTNIGRVAVYPCKDGFIRMRMMFPQWSRFVQLLQSPELEALKMPEDYFNLDYLPLVDAIWYSWCADRTKQEIMEQCQSRKIWCGAVNTPLDALKDPQFRHRGFWVEVDHPVSGVQTYPGAPVDIPDAPWAVRRPAPLLGQHNDEVFGDPRVSSREGVIASRQTAFSRTTPAERREEKAQEVRLPLEGIRVVDMAVIWAGNYAAWLLGSLGAEVIHIENPFHYPDWSRWQAWNDPRLVFQPLGGGHDRIPGTHPWNESPVYNRIFWNRKTCSINLNCAEGKDVMMRLIRESDVFVENNSASAVEHLGIGHEVLLGANPRLVCINMPAWGRSGPYKDYVGTGGVHQAIAGEEWTRGYPDRDHPSHNTGRFPMDTAGGVLAAATAIMGLNYRRRTGKGLWVDFAQMQTIPNQLAELYMDAAWNKRNPQTLGNRHPTAVQGCYLCRGPEPTLETAYLGGERWVNITIHNNEEWEGFCRALSNPEWTRNEKFADPSGRRTHQDELDQHIEAWTKQHDSFEVFHLLQQHGVPAGPVLDWRDTYMDPQLNFRGFFVVTGSEDVGLHRYPGFPWKFSETPLRVTSRVARLAEHTEHVCKDILGMSDGEYADLKGKEVVGRDTYPWAPPRPDYEGWAREHGIEL